MTTTPRKEITHIAEEIQASLQKEGIWRKEFIDGNATRMVFKALARNNTLFENRQEGYKHSVVCKPVYCKIHKDGREWTGIRFTCWIGTTWAS